MQAKEPGTQPRLAPPCPIGRAADVLGDRWTLLILRNATVGATRFEEFKSDLGIADNILSTRLSRLVDAGLMTKVPYRDNGRSRHEYRLTSSGADVLPLLHALGAWGQRHTEPGQPSDPMQIIHLACGHTTTDERTCDHCGQPIERDQEAWLRPWRSATPFPLARPVGPDSPAPAKVDSAPGDPAQSGGEAPA
ncbi:MAG: winged helix-turn-helix transcriptional regulator [Trebonia sp.]